MKIITRQLDFIPEYDLRSICPLEEMLLFDIETTGLKKETTQLYLIGCAYFENNKWWAKQWLTESASDEISVLQDFLEFTSSFTTIITFNGEGFDIPYIQYKSDYYMTGINICCMNSFDIYKKAKRARQILNAKKMSQKAVEEFLGIYRDDKLNGGLLIPVYFDYEKSGDPKLEELLLLHNYDDIQGMLKILPVLTYTDGIEGGYDFSEVDEFDNTLILEYKLHNPVPVYCENTPKKKGYDDILVCMDHDLLQINIKIYNEIGKLPLENISDYYYLPDEDRVIHKSVAEFVDKSRRKKANKSNCFIKKEGRFVPQVSSLISPAFKIDGDKKRTYVCLDDLMNSEDHGIFMHIASDILNAISCC